MTKIACSTSAFKMPLDDALANVKRLGFESVDLIGIRNWGQVSLPDLVEDFDTEIRASEQLVEKHGLEPIAFNFSFPHASERTDEDVNAQRLKEVRAAAKFMKHMHIPVGSFFPGRKEWDRDWEPVAQDCLKTYHEVMDIAAELDVTIAPELHYNTPFETIEQGVWLLEQMPDMPIVYDPSHYALQEFKMEETRPFIDRAVHVHVRDAAPEQMVAPVGEGTVDFEKMVEMLNAAGYQGNYSIEYLPGKAGEDYEELVKMKGIMEKLT